jgi:hypothetical protein
VELVIVNMVNGSINAKSVELVIVNMANGRVGVKSVRLRKTLQPFSITLINK